MQAVRDDSGATAVTTVLLLSGIFLVSGLVIGLGMMSINSSRIQNAADALALAAGRQCQADEATCDATQLASSLASLASANNVQLGSITADTTNKTVTIQATSNFDLPLGQLFGQSTSSMDRNASASWAQVSAPLPTSVYPLFVNKCLFDTYGQNVAFTKDFAGKNSDCANGYSHFTWLQTGGQSVCTYTNISVGWVDSISNNPPANCPASHTVAIFTEETSTPDRFLVVGFADIELISAQQTGGQKPVTMKFTSAIRFADSSSSTGSGVRLIN